MFQCSNILYNIVPLSISQSLSNVSEKIRLAKQEVWGKEQPRFLLYKTPKGISGAKWSTFKMRQGKPRWPGHTKFVLGKWDTVHNVCLGLSSPFSPLQLGQIFICDVCLLQLKHCVRHVTEEKKLHSFVNSIHCLKIISRNSLCHWPDLITNRL